MNKFKGKFLICSAEGEKRIHKPDNNLSRAEHRGQRGAEDLHHAVDVLVELLSPPIVTNAQLATFRRATADGGFGLGQPREIGRWFVAQNLQVLRLSAVTRHYESLQRFADAHRRAHHLRCLGFHRQGLSRNTDRPCSLPLLVGDLRHTVGISTQ